MMKHILKPLKPWAYLILGMGGLSLLSACAQVTETACNTSDPVEWYKIGKKDALSGVTNRNPNFRQVCGISYSRVDDASYEAGYLSNLDNYCKELDPFKLGSQGRRLPSTCTFSQQERITHGIGATTYCQQFDAYKHGQAGNPSLPLTHNEITCPWTTQQQHSFELGRDNFCSTLKPGEYGAKGAALPEGTCQLSSVKMSQYQAGVRRFCQARVDQENRPKGQAACQREMPALCKAFPEMVNQHQNLILNNGCTTPWDRFLILSAQKKQAIEQGRTALDQGRQQ